MTVTAQEVARYLRMGGSVPEGALAARIEELIASAERVLRPARIDEALSRYSVSGEVPR